LRDKNQFCRQSPQKVVAMTTPLWGLKNLCQTIVYVHSSTNPDKLPKIAIADFEISGLTAIVKTNKTEA